jgi:hypothetical protein
MATDLKQIWFDAIEQRNMNQLYRLLYLTPSAEAGITRLSWTRDGTYPSDDMLEKLGPCEGMNGLSYAIMHGNHFDIVRTLVMVSR